MRPVCFALLSALVGCGAGPAEPDAPGEGDAPGELDAPFTDAPSSDAPLDTPPAGALAILFVGNSYVFVNDVPGRFRSLLTGRFEPLRIEQATAGGYTLAQHATDARADGTPLATFLRTGPAAENDFDFVVLQEQSQIGGFPDGYAERTASVAAARELAALATARGAEVVLYLTWGRARGDELNPGLFGTFTAMQDRLDAGYLAMADVLRADGAAVRVAPVGGAFRIVHEDVVLAGLDPLADGSEFLALYEPDGSHPSVRGAYLSGCVFAGTTTDVDVTTLPDAAKLGPEVSASLRGVCARALADPRWD